MNFQSKGGEDGEWEIHYGPQQKKMTAKNSHLVIHFPTSSEVNERCEQTSEGTSEWPSIKIAILRFLAHGGMGNRRGGGEAYR